MHEMLNDAGHEVLSALDVAPSATDQTLLALATQERRVIVTEDKDFGELVFVRRLPHPCIVRFGDMQVAEKVDAMRDLIEHHQDAMNDSSIIVVTRNRVRIRPGIGTQWELYRKLPVPLGILASLVRFR